MQPQNPNDQDQNAQPQPQQPNPGAYQPPAEQQPAYQQQSNETQTPPVQQQAQPQPQAGQPNPAPEGPQQMYYSRPLEPPKPIITPAIRQKCEESRAKYPKLNLSEGEFIVNDVKRHPIGMIQIWGFVFVVIASILAVVALLVSGSGSVAGANTGIKAALALGALLLSSLALIAGYIGTFIYRANTFYLTNESVIQNIQSSLFSNREQTVSLGNVEDASYHRDGIIQTIFDYGTVRLSTQGDETTYRFTYASHPAKQIAKLNDAVEAFKNGRPVNDDDDS